MSEVVNVVIKEDDSIAKKIEKTAQKLGKKYGKTRYVNEKALLKGTSIWRRIFSIAVDVLLIGLCVICCGLGISSFLFKINRVAPSFAGYSFMQVASGSMIADGFDIGENIVVQKVDPKTLNVGDNIAFYVYGKDYTQFNHLETTAIKKQVTEHEKNMTFAQFFGVPSKDIQNAAKANSRLVFHKIIRIYEDENGMYWFQTKGSSNEVEDYWKVSERMVVGIHNNSGFANFVSSLLKLLSNNLFVIGLIAAPLIFMTIKMVFNSIKKVQLARLELDVVEEKRKLTDEICVKNNVGFNMSKKTKYKVLAQAPEDKKEEYVSLLWKDGSAPTSIRKYVIRKHLTLKPMQKLLELNRKCERMFKEGKDGKEIAQYYIKQKEEIENEQARYKKIFKNIRNKNLQNANNG